MPRNAPDEDSSSSSSDSSRSHGGRDNETNTRTRTNRNRCEVESSCGIKTVNELQVKKLGHGKIMKTAEANASTQDGRAWAGARATDHRSGVYSAEASAGITAHKNGDAELLRATADADAQFGMGGAIAEAGADATYLRFSDNKSSLDLLKGTVGVGVGLGLGGGKAKLEAGVDLVSMEVRLGENQSMNTNLGLNADTGAEFGVDGVDVSFVGWGASVGRNTGIHTPFGSISFKLW